MIGCLNANDRKKVLMGADLNTHFASFAEPLVGPAALDTRVAVADVGRTRACLNLLSTIGIRLQNSWQDLGPTRAPWHEPDGWLALSASKLDFVGAHAS
eukprot:10518144-Karenia_brevis.AAC.1